MPMPMPVPSLSIGVSLAPVRVRYPGGMNNPLQRFARLRGAVLAAPTPDAVQFLHDVYLLVRTAPESIGAWPRQRMFEAAADALNSWQVVAISSKAARSVVSTRKNTALRRGHALGRKERYDMLFGDRSRLRSPEQLVGSFFKHDLCAVITDEENREHGFRNWSPLYVLPANVFQAKPGVFAVPVRIKKPGNELAWCTDLLRAIERGEREPDWQAPAAPAVGPSAT